MTTTAPRPPPVTWQEENQRHLAAALGGIRRALQRHAVRVQGDSGPAAPQPGEELPPEMAGEIARPPALETLCTMFRLSAFERDLLLLCAGMELDARFASLCAAAQGDADRAYPTFSVALAALPGAHWSALAPAAPLRRWRLIEIGTAHALTVSPLRIDERVLHALCGLNQPDDRLAGIVEAVPAPGPLVPSHQAVAEQIAAAWSQAPAAPLVIQLCGTETEGKRRLAAAACAAVGLNLTVIAAEALPSHPGEVEPLFRLWEREAILSTSALLLDCDELEAADAARAAVVGRWIERARGALLVACPERRQTRRPMLTLEVRKPKTAEQRSLWREALGAAAAPVPESGFSLLTSQFDVSAPTIRAAGAEALARCTLATNGARANGTGHGEGLESASAPVDMGRVLWDACRVQARQRLDNLAQRIEGAAAWDELVLPETQQQILRDIAAHVRQRATVYETWGFAGKSGRGLGISALFAGVSGTGKTMAAEVLAHELCLDLYRIDLSSVVSKYIGETEKNLSRVFDAAEEGGAVLLFDEADALFGKRSEVKDSHDRYANIEVSYLLQRMESYRGLAILTTNLKAAIDPAFLRRIRFVVQFPFPDAAQRAQIWQRIFPVATPTEGLDARKLAQLIVAGGNIRNAALNAAFLAADAGEPVRMTHLLRAARSEYAKLEKTLTDAEVAGWV